MRVAVPREKTDRKAELTSGFRSLQDAGQYLFCLYFVSSYAFKDVFFVAFAAPVLMALSKSGADSYQRGLPENRGFTCLCGSHVLQGPAGGNIQ